MHPQAVLLLKAEKSGIHLILFKNQVQRAFSPQLQSNLLESCSKVKYWAKSKTIWHNPLSFKMGFAQWRN